MPKKKVTKKTTKSTTGTSPAKKGQSPNASPRLTRSNAIAESPSKLTPTKTTPPPSKAKSSPAKEKSPPKMSLSKQFKLAEEQKVESSPKRGRGATIKKTAAKKGRKKDNAEETWKVGDMVEALWDADGFFYSAKIMKVINNSKQGVTYDVQFVQDKVMAKSRKPSQIQRPTDDNEDEEAEEEEEDTKSRSRSSSPSKKKRVEDEEYVENKPEYPASDYEVLVSSSSSSESGEEYDEKKATKRKRVASSPKKVPVVTKKRKLELRDNMSKLTKEQILNLIIEVAEKKPTIVADLEKGVPQKKAIKK
jgi:hypothetical protein